MSLPGDKVDLTGLRSLEAVLERLPQGSPARTLAAQLGLFDPQIHTGAGNRRKQFGAQFSRMSNEDLSDANGYWLSEVFRATELCGLFEGQRMLLTMEVKATRARVRSQLRKTYQDKVTTGEVAKAPAATQLNDEVEEDEQVQAVEAMLGLLAVVQESAKAYKEACASACAGISREISFRQAQMQARLR
jgi:hypothetical protein